MNNFWGIIGNQIQKIKEKNIGESIKENSKNISESIGKNIGNQIQKIKEKNIGESIKEKSKNIGKSIKENSKNISKSIGEKIGNQIQKVNKKIQEKNEEYQELIDKNIEEKIDNSVEDNVLNKIKPMINDKNVQKLFDKFKNIVEKNAKGFGLNLKDVKNFESIEEKLKEIKNDNTTNERTKNEIDDTLAYIENLKDNINLDESNIEHSNKTIVQFKRIADMCRYLILLLATMCIVIIFIVLLISFFNVFNLSIRIIINIISLFYNSVITNNQTISYSAKQIINCSKNNYKNDIFNVLHEQSTSFSVFNTAVYIIYILLLYVILYIIALVFVFVYQYTHVLKGDLRDIDPKFQLLTIVAIIFITSFIHLLIYKFFFRKLTINKFKEIDNYEKNIDSIILNNISPINKEFDNDFYDLLTDSTKRIEIDNIFSRMVEDIDQPSTKLEKYLILYNIYMYFDEYIYMNDVIKEELKNYFKLGDETVNTRTFISFIDANERKLIKLYHEDLPFYKQIPVNKLSSFQKVNETVSQNINKINKHIIKFSGTFYPFLFACIYIFGIFLFNVFCTYILSDFIISTEEDNLFFSFLYTITHKYKDLILYIYNIFKK